MKTRKRLIIAALFVLVTAGASEAAKGGGKGGGKGGDGGGVPTNYGCGTLKAGTVLRTTDGTSQKTLLMNTYACYLCNMTTRVCAIQSPSSLVGWTFILP